MVSTPDQHHTDRQRAGDGRMLKRIYESLFDHFGPQHWWPGDSPFEIMVGAILTQSTNWRNVQHAIEKIKSKNLFDPELLLKKRALIPRLIQSAGFYQVKSKRLTSFLKYFVTRYSGDPGRMRRKDLDVLRAELLDINGIGQETADSILLYALGKPVFVIDAYTRRIFSRHGFFAADTDYDHVRTLFESCLPRRVKLFNEYHALLVRTGKEYCRKNEPLCRRCPLHPFKRST